MTNEDTAWEQFSKADAANIGDASAVGMLQAIMAELNSIRADTARLEQKIDGGAGEAPMDAGMPPMDEGAPAEMPPMDAGAPPADAGTPPMSAPPEESAMPLFEGGMEAEPFVEDETLNALQDALSQVTDPEAIVKLADIIKEYVAGSQAPPVEEAAPETTPEIPPEVLVEALMEEAPAEEPVADVPPEVMDSLLRSEDAQPAEATETVQESCGEKTIEPMAESTEASAEEPGAKAPEVSAPAETVAASDEESEPEPAIQINLFLGAKMEDIIDDNAKKGLTNKDNLPTDSFKVCDMQKSFKRSIDDLINQNMRKQSGIDGKRYKISKSANELAIEELQSIQKSIGSFDAVKDMRVGDILTTMQGLGKRGMTSIEKSYEPMIDEMVKYCDNNISPLYTEPIFRKFGLDLGKIYEPLDTTPFERKLPGLDSVAPKSRDLYMKWFEALRKNPNILFATGMGSASNRFMNAPIKGRTFDETIAPYRAELDDIADNKLLSNLSSNTEYPIFGELAGLTPEMIAKDQASYGPAALRDQAAFYRWLGERYPWARQDLDLSTLRDLINLEKDHGLIYDEMGMPVESRLETARGNARNALGEARLVDALNKQAGYELIPSGYTRHSTSKKDRQTDLNNENRLRMNNDLLAAMASLRDSKDGISFNGTPVTLGGLLEDLGLSSLDDVSGKVNLADTVAAKYGANDIRNPRIKVGDGENFALASQLMSALIKELAARGINVPSMDEVLEADENAEELDPTATTLHDLRRVANNYYEGIGDYEETPNLLKYILNGGTDEAAGKTYESLDKIFNSQIVTGKDENNEEIKGDRTRSADAAYDPLLYTSATGDDGKETFSPRFGSDKEHKSLKDLVTYAMGGDKYQGWKEARNTLGQTKALQYLYPSAGTMDAFTMNAEMPRNVMETLLGESGEMKEEDILPELEKRFGTPYPSEVDWDTYDTSTLGGRNAIENVQTTMDPLARISSRNNPRELLGEFMKNPKMDLATRDKELSRQKREEKKAAKQASSKKKTPPANGTPPAEGTPSKETQKPEGDGGISLFS